MLKTLLAPFSLCAACQKPAHPTSLPLCHTCFDSLSPCPPLCHGCGGPTCRDTCTRPWSDLAPLSSLHSTYLCVGSGYSVLKAWKKKPGALLSSIVLSPLITQAQKIGLGLADAVVPIPQSFHRAIELSGSSSLRIAQAIARAAGLPLFEGLSASVSEEKRQAQRNRMGRWEKRPEFSNIETKEILGKRVVLVDDFLTTGETLRAGALTLKQAGASEVHGWVLGLRPSFLKQALVPEPTWAQIHQGSR